MSASLFATYRLWSIEWMIEDQTFHDVLPWPADKLRANIAMFQLPRYAEPGIPNRSANHYPLAGHVVKRLLTKGTRDAAIIL